jgi:hypothetical protein
VEQFVHALRQFLNFARVLAGQQSVGLVQNRNANGTFLIHVRRGRGLTRAELIDVAQQFFDTGTDVLPFRARGVQLFG